MNIFAEAARLEAENRPFVMATIASAHGSTPRSRGRMLVCADGSTIGSIGGGAFEQIVIREALDALAEGTSRTVQRELQRDLPRELQRDGKNAAAMHCVGNMEVYLDVVAVKPTLVLIGGGHVNLAVAYAARDMDITIGVVENRPEFSGADRFPMARWIIRNDDFAGALSNIDRNAAVVVAAASNELDALRYALNSPAGYVGLLGSKQKAAEFLSALRAEGMSRESLERLHAPIGLDIGAETPAEIAVSILAEILAFRTRRNTASLRRMVDRLVVIRGAGDIATGVALRLFRSGFPVVCLEIPRPTVIRRTVSFAQALYDTGEIVVEGVRAVRAESVVDVYTAIEQGFIPVLPDPDGESLEVLRPAVLVDAILAKRNVGTRRDMAPVTIALGPGFTAGTHADADVDAVVETNRGHSLGRVILDGSAAADTGLPGTVGGESARRVVRSPGDGVFQHTVSIGDLVHEGDILGTVGDDPVPSPLTGLVRGLLADGLTVTKGFKIGDVDPRGADVDWHTVSDKARAVAGGVLEATLFLLNRR